MTLRSPSWVLVRGISLVAVAIALATAVGVLAHDQATNWNATGRWDAYLNHAEEAARGDPAKVVEFQAAVDRYAHSTLARERKQRAAGLTALAAAAVGIALVRSKWSRKPVVPAGIIRGVELRRATAAEATSPVDATSPSVWATSVAHEPQVHAPANDEVLKTIVDRVGRESGRLIPLLHAIDQHYHYLPPEALERLPALADVTATQVAGVTTFYSQFRTQPRGRCLIQVCQGTACHVAGADRVMDQLRRELGIPSGGDTDSDCQATVEGVGCLGCCTRAPVVRVDEHTLGHVHVEDLPRVMAKVNGENGAVPSDRRWLPWRIAQTLVTADDPRKPPLEIRVGLGSCCVAGGSREVMETIQHELRYSRLQAVVKSVGCVGICHLTPLVEVHASGVEPVVATRATAADVRRILRSLPGGVSWPVRLANRVSELWHTNGSSTNGCESGCQISPLADNRIQRFVSPQLRIVTEHSGEMDPLSLAEYRDRGGFAALARVLAEGPPASVIDTIEKSGLRGRGGAGFPTHRKWRLVAAATGDKYLICNGDEGDPGAFMDRMVMESYPYRVLEGMAVAAYAVGAHKALVYVRHEYPLAVERMRHAIAEMTRAGWLGERVAASDFALSVEVVEGAGAFVCGEETALLESIMGRRGTPQHRPPYPAERGLWDQPTLVNNVETFANIPWIIHHGPEEFSRIGTADSKGTKVFSLAGKVQRGGLIEVPMGLTIRQIVEEIGGGVAPGKQFKAVQIGGPSGGCIPASLADTPIDYEALRGVGAIMGSGGLVVMDSDDCMVDMARYFLEFTQRESCGHCTFCRLGTKRLLEILERICSGRGQKRDLAEIESLSTSVVAGSLCGLGKTAPNPVLTTLRYFREEYEAHLAGRCPAGRCKALIRYQVTRECVGCTLCAQHCPVGAIPVTPYAQHVIDTDLCTRCDVCRTQCPVRAIEVV